ncbi:helix-turn-helix domain-containing protein [Streptomyces sp. NPDC059459]|uniref:helix-turn-helix domain-containing protein n=1 Tax=Streptomyces sp. NPDC059459 TaxID=3346839 RepID=UPI0036B01F21
MENQDGPALSEVRDPAGFIESMRRLKQQSGLTYRELEERAAQVGDVLPRSTLADVLRRTTLPPPNLLAAFVRACGHDQHTGTWLSTRRQIAAGLDSLPMDERGPAPSAAVVSEPRTEVIEQTIRASPHRTKRSAFIAGAALGILLTGGLVWWLMDGEDGQNTPASRTPTGGWVTIRSASIPDLCLTDGRDRSGGYSSAVAVQLPCAQAPVPRTYLEPMGEGLHRIQWHHPVEGKGCLTVMSSGAGKGLIEPRENCAQGTLFRLRPTTAGGPEGFQLRPSTGTLCIGLTDDGTTEGAAAREEPCTNSPDQRFLVRASP